MKIAVALLILFCAAIAWADQPQPYQWTDPLIFNGGINIMSDKGQLATNQLYQASNMIWRDGQMQVREGFDRYVEPLSANCIRFIDIFRNTGGAAYLMYSDGASLWYRSNLTDASTELEFGRSNVGNVDTYNGVLRVFGNAPTTQKWRTIFGTGEGLTITVGSTDYTVSKIVLDTLIFVTANPGANTGASYNIDYDAITISDALVISDDYWIYSNTGKFYFNRPDSFVIVDSLSGLRYSYSAVARKCTGAQPYLQFTATGVATNYAGKFLRIVTDPKSAGGTANPITANHHFYMSYPIWTSGSNALKTYAAAFIPDSTGAEYFTVEQLVYDSTTKFTTRVDSVRIDSTGLTCGGMGAKYLKIYCDTCFFDADTGAFITGDWFVSPNYEWSFSGQSASSYFNGHIYTQPAEVFPVVGGFRATDSAFYAACPPDVNDNVAWDIDSNNVEIVFYRMKKNVSGERSSGLRFATVFHDRVFTAKDTSCNQIEWSEPFLPDSTISTSVMIIATGDGECITTAAQQYADLIVYFPDSRWKIYGDGTNAGYGKERINGNVGCVAKGSLVAIGNTHYFLHSSGYYASDGSDPVLVSATVNGYFTDSINTDEYDKVVAGYDFERDNIWISFPTIGSTVNNRTLVYNVGTQSWWPQTFIAGAYAYNSDLEVSDSARLIVGATDSSTIFIRSGTKDDGADITGYFQTGFMDYGAPELGKYTERFLIKLNATCDSVSQVAYADTVTSVLSSVSFIPKSGWSLRKIMLPDATYWGNYFSHKFTLYDAATTKVPFIKLRYRLGGENE